MNSRMEVENFSGTSIKSIYQGFHAKAFSLNFTAVLIPPVQDQVDQKSHRKQYTYQVNATFTVSTLEDSIVRLLAQS